MLGITAACFWSLTMPEFSLVVDQVRERRRIDKEQADWRTARIMAMLHAAHFKPPRREAKDFMPRVIKPMTPADMYRAVKEHHKLLA